jgi:acetyl-CoA C-acetyltransferase
LVDVEAVDLGRVAVEAAIERAGVPTSEIDDLVLAESMQGGGVLARYIACDLGMTAVPGLAVNRHCAASLAAVQIGAAAIMAGACRVVVAGGTESMSSTPQLLKAIPASSGVATPWRPLSHPDGPDAPAWDMAVTVGENTARIAGITRQDADAWALRSHLRAAGAVASGRFDDEIVPVVTGSGDERSAVTVDEQPRGDTSLEKLAALPVLHPEIPGAVVTAGNSAGLNDGAAAVVLADPGVVERLSVAPLGRVLGWATVGVDPVRTGLAPVEAVPRALAHAGVKLDEIDLFEINEAFATMAVATVRQLGLDAERVNVNGSGCGLGHPIAATGARMVVSMLYELHRRGGRLGCVAMCAGGGMGSAVVLEVE